MAVSQSVRAVIHGEELVHFGSTYLSVRAVWLYVSSRPHTHQAWKMNKTLVSACINQNTVSYCK